MRDVALVPQRDVLERRLAVGADQTGEPDDLLAPDWIALVRHGGRALLPFGERLFDLADLGLLQAADLERELLERRRGNGEGRHQLGVPIALDHLVRDGRRVQAEPLADLSFNARRKVRVSADRAGNLADVDRDARALDPLDAALQLGVPERE